MSDFISELFDKNVTYLVSLGCIMGLILVLCCIIDYQIKKCCVNCCKCIICCPCRSLYNMCCGGCCGTQKKSSNEYRAVSMDEFI